MFLFFFFIFFIVCLNNMDRLLKRSYSTEFELNGLNNLYNKQDEYLDLLFSNCFNKTRKIYSLNNKSNNLLYNSDSKDKQKFKHPVLISKRDVPGINFEYKNNIIDSQFGNAINIALSDSVYFFDLEKLIPSKIITIRATISSIKHSIDRSILAVSNNIAQLYLVNIEKKTSYVLDVSNEVEENNIISSMNWIGNSNLTFLVGNIQKLYDIRESSIFRIDFNSGIYDKYFKFSSLSSKENKLICSSTLNRLFLYDFRFVKPKHIKKMHIDSKIKIIKSSPFDDCIFLIITEKENSIINVYNSLSDTTYFILYNGCIDQVDWMSNDIILIAGSFKEEQCFDYINIKTKKSLLKIEAEKTNVLITTKNKDFIVSIAPDQAMYCRENNKTIFTEEKSKSILFDLLNIK